MIKKYLLSNLKIEIIAIGSFALELNNISLDRATRDIDSIKKIDPKLASIIREIAEELKKELMDKVI